MRCIELAEITEFKGKRNEETGHYGQTLFRSIRNFIDHSRCLVVPSGRDWSGSLPEVAADIFVGRRRL